MYKIIIKRAIDILISLLLLIALSPLMLLIFLLLLLTSSESPIFTQRRAGRKERPFELFKFRTMNTMADTTGQPAPDQQRLTPRGRWLRKYSLDELPQLINVLRGEMSLIGPRPLFMRYLAYYRTDEQKRHHVRPGISGWAQVNGRNNCCWDDRLAMDVYYVEQLSFSLDLKIFYKTILNILLSKDVVVDESYLIDDLNVERSGHVSSN